jgi:hypothetical protein
LKSDIVLFLTPPVAKALTSHWAVKKVVLVSGGHKKQWMGMQDRTSLPLYVQVLLAAFSAMLVYMCSRLAATEATAIVAALLVSCDLGLSVINIQAMTESLFLALLVGSTSVWVFDAMSHAGWRELRQCLPDLVEQQFPAPTHPPPSLNTDT